jgi:hypothetical protein
MIANAPCFHWKLDTTVSESPLPWCEISVDKFYSSILRISSLDQSDFTGLPSMDPMILTWNKAVCRIIKHFVRME